MNNFWLILLDWVTYLLIVYLLINTQYLLLNIIISCCLHKQIRCQCTSNNEISVAYKNYQVEQFHAISTPICSSAISWASFNLCVKPGPFGDAFPPIRITWLNHFFTRYCTGGFTFISLFGFGICRLGWKHYGMAVWAAFWYQQQVFVLHI